MNSRSLTTLAAIVIAIPIALWLGVSLVQQQATTVLQIGGALFFCLCLALGRHVWILIPATLGMRGGLNFLPGSPPPWAFMTLAVGGFLMVRILSRKQPLNLRWTGMDTALLLVALTIVQAFVRNPTGLAAFGGDVAGGKAYIVYCCALATFWLVGVADADKRSWCWAVWAFIGVTALDGVVAVASAYSSTFAISLVPFYSNVSYASFSELGYGADIQEVRISQFGQLGTLLGLMACTLWRPVSALNPTKPWRGVIAVLAVACVMLSGFRGALGRLFVNFVVGSCLRRKPLDIALAVVVGLLMLATLLVAVPTDRLPYSVQRILTVMPGFKARSDIASEAQGSIDVRVEAWYLALFTDRYISNKLLGDGFQMSASELAFQHEIAANPEKLMHVNFTDVILATGDYHGFHAETVRVTGVVGLVSATAALIAFAVFAMRHIRFFESHAEWPLVLFVCMPFLIAPFWYWLVFGAYKVDFPVLIAQAGMLKLLCTIEVKEKNERQRLGGAE